MNSDYEAKRANNITLTELKIHDAQPDLFYNWLKEKDKLGGQHKIPRLSNSRDYMEELLRLQSQILA
ncbi:putative auxin-regulated protein [Nonlabens ulvanivorans]|uniref:Putative auxin-regulated protein n=1 Tax=Nonlabens ulvanivorans TaxID=906888 RepID=A0A090Q5S5_NONUL|nr:putative auxin-regulated protein [Nonlabens ulvanivorans]